MPRPASLRALLPLCLTLAACNPATREVVQTDPDRPAHHAPGGGFRNTQITDPSKTLFDYLAMKHFGNHPWADHAARAAEVPVHPVDMAAIGAPGAAPQVTWLGHSTFLIQAGGMAVLTDPVFADRASPFSFAGPRRYVPHVIDYAALPPIDLVIISHNHYDHLDETAIGILGNGPRYAVPLGLKAWFTDQGVAPDRVTEFDWWDEKTLAGRPVTALPSQHWSARGLGDRRRTLWASWLLELPGLTLWFAGDTGYNPVQFKQIGQHVRDKGGAIDLGLIPIGGYLPRSFMGPYHVNPEEALYVHRDVGARRSIGMHWGTFPLTAEGPGDPVRDLAAGRDRLGIAPEAFSTMAVGETRVVQPAPDQPAPVQPAPVQPARAARSPSDGANQ
ncbi:MAG: MBL fold metallo-hydrolase [Rhodobacterales bacterium]|nr:MBL fold metallo-hydrolase [Rhodobacterales bacterium]